MRALVALRSSEAAMPHRSAARALQECQCVREAVFTTRPAAAASAVTTGTPITVEHRAERKGLRPANAVDKGGGMRLAARARGRWAPISVGPSQRWGSGCGDHVRERVVGGLEALPEAGAERTVVDGTADLKQAVGAAPGP